MVYPKISVAPMMDYTDRHYRYFLRLMTRDTLLYTEMITTQAILYGNRDLLLRYDSSEHPLALQLGGSDPVALAECARVGEQMGYDEINLNVGCPSDRVQSGRFGACLMKEPQVVADCVAAMAKAVRIPVTVKTRIGVDDKDTYQDLTHFISTVAKAGCSVFIVHARKAWLKGLSPKENREIPPLRYDVVSQIKKDFPELTIVINGGVHDLSQALTHLQEFDGVMVGRAAYHNAYIMAQADQLIYGSTAPVLTREAILEQYMNYIEKEYREGTPLTLLTKPLLGLFQAVPGARAWRRRLSEGLHQVNSFEAFSDLILS